MMCTVTKLVRTKSKQTKKQRVAAYCRVSTDTTKQELSLENQEIHYQSLIEEHPSWKLVGIFHDDGISGTKMDNRQGLANLLAACEEHRVDLVITKSISRLARNTTDCLHIVRKLKGLKIPIIFERENINTSSMDGELMLTVLSSLAQDESASISKNIKLGIRHRAESGTYHHSFAPYGYRKVGKDLVIDPEQSQVVKHIFKAYSDGLSVNKIVDQLNANGIKPQRGKQWYDSTVLSMLKNPTFTGTLALGQTETNDSYNRIHHYDPESWLLIPNHHPAIVYQATFEKVQQNRKLKNSVRRKANYHKHYPFTKIITCAQCENNFKRHKNGNASYWVCTKHLHDVKSCPVTAVREERIMLAWMTMMNKLHFSWKFLFEPFIEDLETGASKEGLADDIQKQIQDQTEKLKTLATLLEQGVVDHDFYQSQQKQIHDEINRLQTTGGNVSITQQHLRAARKLLKLFKEDKTMMTEFSKHLFKESVENITIDKQHCITFHLKCGLNLREQV